MSASQPQLEDIVARNVRALLRARAELDARRTRAQRVADAITSFTGSLRFVYLHVALFGGWLVVNTGVVPGVRPFDPFPFVMLAMIASVEAIFLSTFVLISQNRMAEAADRRAELDLQINVLAEHEVTKLLAVVDAMADKLGVELPDRETIEALKEDTLSPESVERIAGAEGEDQIEADGGALSRAPERTRDAAAHAR